MRLGVIYTIVQQTKMEEIMLSFKPPLHFSYVKSCSNNVIFLMLHEFELVLHEKRTKFLHLFHLLNTILHPTPRKRETKNPHTKPKQTQTL